MSDTLKDASFRRVHTSSDIRLFLTDVDGTLTDGSMYYGSDACVSKCIDFTLAG